MTVVDGLVTNFFFRYGILIEIHSAQGQIFESRLVQVVLD
jgi:hypothetical protein